MGLTVGAIVAGQRPELRIVGTPTIPAVVSLPVDGSFPE